MRDSISPPLRCHLPTAFLTTRLHATEATSYASVVPNFLAIRVSGRRQRSYQVLPM
jgi:hypothetical protein